MKEFDNTVKVFHHLLFWVYSLMVTYLIHFTHTSGDCIKMRPVENVKGNISECIWTIFSSPVPTYFCTEVCDRLPNCSAVTMETGKLTSWCCALDVKTQSLGVCHGNDFLIYSNNVTFFWKHSESCRGKFSEGFFLEYNLTLNRSRNIVGSLDCSPKGGPMLI